MSNQLDVNSNITVLSTSTSTSDDSSSFWLIFRLKLMFLIPFILACIILFLLVLSLLKHLIDYCRKSRRKLTITDCTIQDEK
ncbi:unnamed protein product [Adineta ricciae]|uniref:Uncharacterized protein n=1 Tax=Adineta ricciae TaxID=249248 RepID=A0A814AJH0_ADIRI|nr:unnamed protein product [Adineta ricciae]